MKFSRGAINGSALLFVLAALTLIFLTIIRSCISRQPVEYVPPTADSTAVVKPAYVDTIAPTQPKKRKRAAKAPKAPRVIPTRSPLDDKL